MTPAKGQRWSDAERAAIARRQTGASNSNWRGDEVSYRAAHSRVERARGPAKKYKCSCGQPARDWANLTGKFDDVDDYVALCKPCHCALDETGRKVSEAWDRRRNA